MNYSKPQVVAQNSVSGSYAAGCPADSWGNEFNCRRCDRTK